MLYKLVVPGAVEDVEEIRVLEWHRREGEAIARGALLVELETAKAVVEVRADQDAVVRQLLGAAGTWQAVGTVLALLSDTADEPLPADALATAALFAVEFAVN